MALYIKNRMGITLTAGDIAVIHDATLFCPSYYGEPIHIAQYLESAMFENRITRNEDCGTQLPPRENEKMLTTSIAVKLFPNPNTGQFTLKNESNHTILSLNIYNNAGEKMLMKQLNLAKGSSTNINEELMEGMYMIRLRLYNDEIITKKLIIIK